MKNFVRWLFKIYYKEEITTLSRLTKQKISLDELMWQRGIKQALYTLDLLKD